MAKNTRLRGREDADSFICKNMFKLSRYPNIREKKNRGTLCSHLHARAKKKKRRGGGGGGGEGSNQSSEFFDEAVDRCSAEDHVLAMDSPPSFACVRMKS